jgi:O-antigen ligase
MYSSPEVDRIRAMAQIERLIALRRCFARLPEILVALLPALLTLYFAFESGGFFPGTAALVAAELALLLGAYLALTSRPFAGISTWAGVAVASLAALAAWTLVSSHWSHAEGRALLEYDRVLLYALAVALGAMLPFSSRHITISVRALAVTTVVIALAALTARLFPSLIQDDALAIDGRLAYPLSYWNALGLLCGVGIVFCAHLMCAVREKRIVRALAAAAIPVLATTIYYTGSRGAAWGTLAAVALYATLARPAGLLARIQTGRGRPNLTLLASAGTAAVVVALVGLLLLDVPDRIAASARDFGRSDVRVTGLGTKRLLSTSANGRHEHWRVALEAYAEEKIRGHGGGTYPLEWRRRRAGDYAAQNAHSLYLETLSELGWVGVVVLALALAVLLGGFAARIRGGDRSLFAALFAAGVLWAAHAGVDWDWELPATSVWLFALGGAALAANRRETFGDASAPRRRPFPSVLRVLAVGACVALAVIPARVAISDKRLVGAIDAANAGDCARARDQARSAIDAAAQRPAPYLVLGHCDLLDARYRPAAAEFRRAIERDPDSWQGRLGLALAVAGSGGDGLAEARRAAVLNPYEPSVRTVVTELSKSRSDPFPSAQRLAPPLPVQGDP